MTDRTESDLKTKPEAQYLIREWPEVHRARRPYLIEPVTILYEREKEYVDYVAGGPTERRFLLEPIGDHLLRIQPDDPASFLAFARRFGLGEFVDWALDTDLIPWAEIGRDYVSGKRKFSAHDLETAWTHLHNWSAFSVFRRGLSEAYSTAERLSDEPDVVQEVLALGWEASAFELELAQDPDNRWIYERPRHIFARAWFELIDNVRVGRIPTECPVCGDPFTPARAGHNFDKAECRAKDYTRRERKQDWYRQKERKRKQRDRGRITEAEYQKWLNDHPRPARDIEKEG